MSHHSKWLSRLTGWEIVDLYSRWSEEFWCAGFMELTDEGLTDFIEWLLKEKGDTFEEYELDLIDKFRSRIAGA